MSETQLAIATIPMQQWGELYDDKDALDIGNIFKDLNKPFFAASIVMDHHTSDSEKPEEKKSDEQIKREDMMRKIAQVSFVLDDLTLYLDTHEEQEEAKELYQEKLKEREMLLKEYAAAFNPLTRCQIADCGSHDDRFCWQKGPMPWEGACV